MDCRVYIASDDKWRHIEPVIAHSIRKNASGRVNITFIHPGELGLERNGATGFTMFRYCVPELCDFTGFAIYMDVDMLVIGDVYELWKVRSPGQWVCLHDGSTELMVIDCAAGTLPPITQLNKLKKWHLTGLPLLPAIPPVWNCEDCAPPGAKLVHFTDLSRQPFFTADRAGRDVDLWRDAVRDYTIEHNAGLL